MTNHRNDYFSGCCVYGTQRSSYRKPITEQKMQWVALPSASIIPDSESRLIIRVGQKFSSGMFFLLETSLISFLPSNLAACLTGGWQRRAQEPSEPWPQVEFFDRSGRSCSLCSSAQRQTDSWLLCSCILQRDPGLSGLRYPQFEMHIELCIYFRNLT